MSAQNKKIAPYHRNGTAGVVATPVDLTVKVGQLIYDADYITINNKGANALLISFDNGTTFATINAGNSFDLEWRLSSLIVKTAAGNTDYEIVCVSGKQFRPHVV